MTFSIFLIFLPAATFPSIKDRSPEPQINIAVHPPDAAVVSKDFPVFLPCAANYTGESQTWRPRKVFEFRL